MSEDIGFWKLNAPAADNHPSWVYMDGVFNDKECDDIISMGRALEMKPGTVYDDGSIVDFPSKIQRDALVSWFSPNEETMWMYKRLSIVINQLNNDYYKFDLDGFAEGIQFTEYHSPSGTHGAHMDKAPNGVVRKLTMIIQLTDPDEYEGCDLEIIQSDGNRKLPRKRGTLVAFPSWEWHQVNPITSGTRNSLVAWITGSPFR
jgi:PKHD-type hydroxylase